MKNSPYQIPTILIGLLSSMVLFFRYDLFHPDSLQFGDHYEGFIQIALLEHWHNVLKGTAFWSAPNYFYPIKAALAFNDGYLLYGLIHSLFRALGCSVLLSAELVNVTLRGAGFFLLYAAARRIAGLAWPWAVLAAMLFTIANGSYEQMFHAQLLSVVFVPAAALLLRQWLQAVRQNRRTALMLWGVALLLFYAAWLLTAFYMAWFLALFLLLLLVIWSVLAPGEATGLAAALWRHRLAVTMLLALALLVDLPFLQLYLPAAAATGMHSADTALSFSPSLLDVINVGDKNLLWGWLNRFLRETLRPGFPLHSEKNSGFPLIFLTLCGLSLLSLLRSGTALTRAIALTSLVSALLFMHFGRFSLYPWLYDLMPGAAAVRAISRYQLFLAAPLSIIALLWLARRGSWGLLRAPLLLAEQVNGDQIARINRSYELARLASIPPAPAQCQAFYISRPRDETFLTREITDIYSLSADAMLIAEQIGLPTINGFASLLPPGYDLFRPAAPDYEARVADYVELHHIAGLCGLDLQAMRWDQARLSK